MYASPKLKYVRLPFADPEFWRGLVDRGEKTSEINLPLVWIEEKSSVRFYDKIF